MRNLLIVYLLFLMSSCVKQPLQRTWFVVSDGGYGDQVNYRSIYTFTRDSLSIDFLGAKTVSTKIRLQTDSTIITDSLPIINYHIKSSDTLKLSFSRSKLDTVELTLIPFRPIIVKKSKKEIETLLLNKNWIYEYEGIKFDATFLDKYFSPEIRYSEIQVYYGNKLDRTLEMPLWKIESHKNQFILIIENSMDPFYANTFYINGIMESNHIETTAWQNGKKYEITFRNDELIDSLEILNVNNRLIDSWSIKSAKQFKEPEIDPDDTTYIDLGHLPIWGTINMNTVIEESDLIYNEITYNFLPDSSFQILKKNSVVCKGRWVLQRNGRVVKIITESALSDEYQSDCNDFSINQLTEDSLNIEQWIPIYQNDSTVPNRYYELQMIKTQ